MGPQCMECGIGMGSNRGSRPDHLQAAAAALRKIDPGVIFSPVFETEPVDCPPDSGSFFNAVAVLRWSGSPRDLLEVLRGIEAAQGRPGVRSHHAPRTIDLDILYAGDHVSTDAVLVLPHPRMHERRFVLAPLGHLRPGLILPGFTRPVRDLLAALPPAEIRLVPELQL